MLTRNKIFIIFLILLGLSFGCKDPYKNYDDKIIGIWTRTIDESSEVMPYGYKKDIRYVFYYDSANFYPGSFEVLADYGEFARIKLITNRMDYKLRKDQLVLKYLVKIDSSYTHEIEKFRILKLNSDTLMLLRQDSIIINFYRLYDVYK